MTDLLHLAIALWVATVLTGIVILRKALAEARTPSPCERDEDRASDVNAELDGGRLPAGMIGDFHSGSNLTQEQRNHG